MLIEYIYRFWYFAAEKKIAGQFDGCGGVEMQTRITWKSGSANADAGGGFTVV